MPIKLLSLHQTPMEILQDKEARLSLLIQFCIFLAVILLGALNHFHFSNSQLSQPFTDQQLKGQKTEVVARIHSIHVYPIKSCAPVQIAVRGTVESAGDPKEQSITQQSQPLELELEIKKKGFQFDRRWVIVDRQPGSKNQGKILSLREENRVSSSGSILSTSQPIDLHSSKYIEKSELEIDSVGKFD